MSFLNSLRSPAPPWRVEVKWFLCLGVGAFGLLTGAAVSAVARIVFSPSALALGACVHISAQVAALIGLWCLPPRGALADKLGIGKIGFAEVKTAFAGLGAIYLFELVALPVWGWLLRRLDIAYEEKQSLMELCAAADWRLFIWLLVLVGVVIPIGEELFFRRLLFGVLRPLGVVAALILTSMIFGALHGFLYGFPVLTVFGAVLQWLYLRTGNLATNILAHSIFNLVSLCAAFFLNGEQ